MGIRWDIIEAKHVRKACELLAADGARASSRAKGLFVLYDESLLPAKAVAKTAFLLATAQPLNTFVDFTSGETLIKRLRNLGYDAVRLPSAVQ